MPMNKFIVAAATVAVCAEGTFMKPVQTVQLKGSNELGPKEQEHQNVRRFIHQNKALKGFKKEFKLRIGEIKKKKQKYLEPLELLKIEQDVKEALKWLSEPKNAFTKNCIQIKSLCKKSRSKSRSSSLVRQIKCHQRDMKNFDHSKDHFGALMKDLKKLTGPQKKKRRSITKSLSNMTADKHGFVFVVMKNDIVWTEAKKGYKGSGSTKKRGIKAGTVCRVSLRELQAKNIKSVIPACRVDEKGNPFKSSIVTLSNVFSRKLFNIGTQKKQEARKALFEKQKKAKKVNC